MKTLTIVILLFVYSTYAQKDSVNKLNADISKNDTSSVNITSPPIKNWWDKNEAAFLGALLAGLVALGSVLLTNHVNKKNKKNKEDEIYCGLLSAIKAELHYHRKLFPLQIQELNAIMELCIKHHEIILNHTSRTIPINFLNKIRLTMLIMENYNTHVFMGISYYINKCDMINNDSNLDNLAKLKEFKKDDGDFNEWINSYFGKIIDEINKTNKAIEQIFTVINADLASMGRENKHPENNELEV